MTWQEWMGNDPESLIEHLTLRRSRLTMESSEPVDLEFSNAQVVGATKANVMCSDLDDGSGSHYLTLDLDMPVEKLESSSGNTHLIIKHRLRFDDIMEILNVLKKYGLVQEKWVESTEKHGFSTLRMPGIDKRNRDDNHGLNDRGEIESTEEYMIALDRKHEKQRQKQQLLDKDIW